MELYPDSNDTQEAVRSLLCDIPIADASEVNLLRATKAHKTDVRATIASALETAEENMFARIDANLNEA
jgi:hypothetical protein